MPPLLSSIPSRFPAKFRYIYPARWLVPAAPEHVMAAAELWETVERAMAVYMQVRLAQLDDLQEVQRTLTGQKAYLAQRVEEMLCRYCGEEGPHDPYLVLWVEAEGTLAGQMNKLFHKRQAFDGDGWDWTSHCDNQCRRAHGVLHAMYWKNFKAVMDSTDDTVRPCCLPTPGIYVVDEDRPPVRPVVLWRVTRAMDSWNMDRWPSQIPILQVQLSTGIGRVVQPQNDFGRFFVHVSSFFSPFVSGALEGIINPMPGAQLMPVQNMRTARQNALRVTYAFPQQLMCTVPLMLAMPGAWDDVTFTGSKDLVLCVYGHFCPGLSYYKYWDTDSMDVLEMIRMFRKAVEDWSIIALDVEGNREWFTMMV